MSLTRTLIEGSTYQPHFQIRGIFEARLFTAPTARCSGDDGLLALRNHQVSSPPALHHGAQRIDHRALPRDRFNADLRKPTVFVMRPFNGNRVDYHWMGRSEPAASLTSGSRQIPEVGNQLEASRVKNRSWSDR